MEQSKSQTDKKKEEKKKRVDKEALELSKKEKLRQLKTNEIVKK